MTLLVHKLHPNVAVFKNNFILWWGCADFCTRLYCIYSICCLNYFAVMQCVKLQHSVESELCRYVYNYLGGKHDNVLDELVASLCTYGITALWLGPGWVVLIWAFFNCFGLNFELWMAKFFSMEPFFTIEVRAWTKWRKETLERWVI